MCFKSIISALRRADGLSCWSVAKHLNHRAKEFLRYTQDGRELNVIKNLLRTIFITIISRFYDSLAVIYLVQEKRKEYIPGCEEDAW